MFVAMNKAHFCHTDCITADKGFLDIANIWNQTWRCTSW